MQLYVRCQLDCCDAVENMHLFIFTYVGMCVYEGMNTPKVCSRLNACLCVCLCVCVCVCLFVSVCVCLYVSLKVCVCVCVCGCVCVWRLIWFVFLLSVFTVSYPTYCPIHSMI
ncbi:unnamed protein product [Gadus morhua 'NCC']